MSEKKRSRVVDYLVYLAVRFLVCVLGCFSFETGCLIAKFLAWMAYNIDKRHRLVALENLRNSFPGRFADAELDDGVRQVYRHFCTMLIEIIHMPRRYNLRNYKRFVDMKNPGQFVELMLSGRAFLFVTGHFGNWEMAGYILGLMGFHTHAIARPLDNPYLDQFLRSFRERNGQKLLAKHGDFEVMEQLLKNGGVLGTLADQDAGQRGIFVDFFGRPASTHKAVALLALEHNVPLVVVGTPKFDGRYCVSAIDVIDPAEYEKTPDTVRAITQRFTTGLETLIRQAPTQYFWLHRRWKHKPPLRKSKKAA